MFFGLQVFGFCLNSVKVSSDLVNHSMLVTGFCGIQHAKKFEIHVLQFKVFGSPLNSVKVSSDSVNHCLLVSYLVKVFPNLVKDMSRVRPVTPMKMHVFLSMLHVLLSNIKFGSTPTNLDDCTLLPSSCLASQFAFADSEHANHY